MTMTLDDEYLEWLYRQVDSVRTSTRAKTYWSLLRQLYKTEFVWSVPNDDNRVEDGKDLRYEFLEEMNYGASRDWLDLGCSVLELLVALSRVLSFEAGGEPRDWFWELIKNLGLDSYTDNNYNKYAERRIASVLNAFIFREYGRNGRGGLFPLKHANRDQRDVEIWYQLNSYLLERF